MNEGAGNTVNDISGYGHHGTLTNNPTWVSGKHGVTVNFDGTVTPDYTHIAISEEAIGSWANISIIACGKAKANQGNYGRLLGTANNNCDLYHRSGGDVTWLLDCSSGSGTVVSSQPIGSWYHYGCVYDGVDVRLYINGILKDTDSTLSGTIDDTGAIYLGIQDADAERWDGPIEYFYIWDRPLVPDEIMQLYIDPFCIFEQSRPELYVTGGAPPAGNSQVIVIMMSGLPAFLVLGIITGLYLIDNRKYENVGRR